MHGHTRSHSSESEAGEKEAYIFTHAHRKKHNESSTRTINEWYMHTHTHKGREYRQVKHIVLTDRCAGVC